MTITVKLNPTGIKNGSGKDNVDAAAMQKYEETLRKELLKRSYVVEGPKSKPQTGFVLDGAFTDVTISTAFSRAKVGVKLTMSVARLPNSSIFAFLSSGANAEGGSTDRGLEASAADAAQAAAEALASKVELAVDPPKPRP